MMSGDEGWVEVARAQNHVEAQVIRGLLDSRGIMCLLSSDVVPHVHPFSVGAMAEVAIAVPAADAPRARALLEQGGGAES